MYNKKLSIHQCITKIELKTQALAYAVPDSSPLSFPMMTDYIPICMLYLGLTILTTGSGTPYVPH